MTRDPHNFDSRVDPPISLPRAALFMPLMEQNEVLGVLEVQNDGKLGYFKPEEQAAVHHLANQAAGVVVILDEKDRKDPEAIVSQLLLGENRGTRIKP